MEQELDLLFSLLKMTQEEIYIFLQQELLKYYSFLDIDKDYIYAKGTYPIMLVAHMDTVYDNMDEEDRVYYESIGMNYYELFPDEVKRIFHDREQNVLWSPQGLGADDRAGIFIILKLLSSGLIPHILFTKDEEIGGVGAKKFIFNNKKSNIFQNINYILELDRRGENEAVFYNCSNKNFEQYITNFGFKKEQGTFTDISIICPYFNIAGVNVSVGYYNEHTYKEFLCLLQMQEIYDIIYIMILESKKIKTPFIFGEVISNLIIEEDRCHCCGMKTLKRNLIEIFDIGFLCEECRTFFQEK